MGKIKKDDEQCVTCSNMRGSMPTFLKEHDKRKNHIALCLFSERTLCDEIFFLLVSLTLPKMISCGVPAISSDENSIFDFSEFFLLICYSSSSCFIAFSRMSVPRARSTYSSFIFSQFPSLPFLCWLCRHLFSVRNN